MQENHKKEQYFFDPPTLELLADMVQDYENIACLCTPMVGKTLNERKKEVSILDTDTRFETEKGFMVWDLYKPSFLNQKFGIILCDPPFFNVSLSQLFKAIRLLSQHDYTQPILLAYLARRKHAVTATFSLFNLQPTEIHLGYVTVQKEEKNDIILYTNIETYLPKDDLVHLQ